MSQAFLVNLRLCCDLHIQCFLEPAIALTGLLSWLLNWQQYSKKVAQWQAKGYCADLWRHRCLPVSACYAPAEHKKLDPKTGEVLLCLKQPLLLQLVTCTLALLRVCWRLTALAASGPFTPCNFRQVEFGLSRLFLFGLLLARNPHAAFLQQLFWDSRLSQKKGGTGAHGGHYPSVYKYLSSCKTTAFLRVCLHSTFSIQTTGKKVSRN